MLVALDIHKKSEAKILAACLQTINPYKPNVISHSYQLNLSIFV